MRYYLKCTGFYSYLTWVFRFFSIKPGAFIQAIVFAFCVFILLAAAALRSTEYDENYTVFLATGQPRPAWPAQVFTAEDMQHIYHGTSSYGAIARDLRQGDVHPPLYFWLASTWRDLVDGDLFRTRLLSVLISAAALALVGLIAHRAGIPPALAMLLCGLMYGFAYTGTIARGFALAQMLTLLGVLLLVRAQNWRLALLGGLALGAATFSNYLAAFVTGAVLLWLLVVHWKRPALWICAGLGVALFLAGDLFFFLAQKDSRAGQFPAFMLLPAILRLAQYGAAGLFGGLPLYVPDMLRLPLTAIVATMVLASVAAIFWAWRRIGTPQTRWLLLMATLAPPIGLLLLGFAFNNTPIELRYIAFCLPFYALLLAGALVSVRWLLPLVLALQITAIAGLLFHPATMQPFRHTAQAAWRLAGTDGLVFIAHGNDGVGIPAAFVQEASPRMQIRVVRRTDNPTLLLSQAASFPRIVIVTIAGDNDSPPAVSMLLDTFSSDRCWQKGDTGLNSVAFEHRC